MTSTVLAAQHTHTARSQQPRFYILDFVRLVAMILMMQGHALDALVQTSSLNVAEFPWNIWHFLRGLTAPIFLLLSGAAQVFANKRDANGAIPTPALWKRVRWAVTLIGVGYLLMFPANRLRDLPFVTAEGWRYFFQVNILQLSGLTLLCMVGVMALTRSTRSFARASLLIGAAILLIAPLADAVNWFGVLPEWAAAYFSYKRGSLFFVFPFSAYMFFGVSIGALLAETPAAERQATFARKTFLYGALALALGIIGTYSPFSLYRQHDYYMASPHFAMIRTGCALLVMSGLSFVYRYTKNLEVYYARLGKKSLYIYTSHLILLFGTPWFGGIVRGHYRALDLGFGALVALAVIAATIGSAYWLDHYQRNSHGVRRGLRFSLTAVVLYALIA